MQGKSTFQKQATHLRHGLSLFCANLRFKDGKLQSDSVHQLFKIEISWKIMDLFTLTPLAHNFIEKMLKKGLPFAEVHHPSWSSSSWSVSGFLARSSRSLLMACSTTVICSLARLSIVCGGFLQVDLIPSMLTLGEIQVQIHGSSLNQTTVLRSPGFGILFIYCHREWSSTIQAVSEYHKFTLQSCSIQK